MNQEKIGNFIAKRRKLKKLTQIELAERLGVTNRSVSKWETGKCLPDISLFKALCSELDITINELLAGEKHSDKTYSKTSETNLLNALEYTGKKVSERNNLISMLLLIFGLFMTFTAMTIFTPDNSWSSIYLVIGGIVSLIGVSRLSNKLSLFKRLLINSLYFIIFIIILLLIDYVSVLTINQAPRFAYSKSTINNMIIYKAPWYHVYRINYHTNNEYYIIDTKNKYTLETVPNVPFNRQKTGIDNLINYQSKYLGDNSNTGNLINSLPLSEYGYVFEINPELLELTINYHITDWYINENYYLEKSLVYNTISLFLLIDNLEYVKYNFSGKTYHTSKEQVINIFNDLNNLKGNGINKDKFNETIENNLNNNDLINHLFKNLFLDENLTKTVKIQVKNSDDTKIINTITNKKDIQEIIKLLSRSTKITGMVNLDGNSWTVYFYNEKNKIIYKFLIWQYNGYSSCFGLTKKEYQLIGLDGERFSYIINNK